MTGRRGSPVFAWGEVWPPMGARAAVVSMFIVFLLANLAAGWLHVVGLTGFGFAAGSAVAAGRTRQHDLLLACTTPPLVFLAAVIAGELITLHTTHVAASAGPVLAGIFLTLAAAAPWLFGGLAGALVIATVRGLPQCVRDLRAELSGRVRPTGSQHSGSQHSGMRPGDNQHSDNQHSDNQHSDNQHSDNQHSESEHGDSQRGRIRADGPGSRWPER